MATKKNETQLSLTFRAEDRFTYWWSPTSIFSFASRLPSLRHPKPNYRNRMCICIKPLYASFQGSCGPRPIESLDTVSLNPYAMALPDTIFECHNPPKHFHHEVIPFAPATGSDLKVTSRKLEGPKNNKRPSTKKPTILIDWWSIMPPTI